jgi:hypothetical protein
MCHVSCSSRALLYSDNNVGYCYFATKALELGKFPAPKSRTRHEARPMPLPLRDDTTDESAGNVD